MRSAINAHRHAMEQVELPFSQKVTDLQTQGKIFPVKWKRQSQNVKTIRIFVTIHSVLKVKCFNFCPRTQGAFSSTKPNYYRYNNTHSRWRSQPTRFVNIFDKRQQSRILLNMSVFLNYFKRVHLCLVAKINMFLRL